MSPWERQLVLHAKRCLQPLSMSTACGGSDEDIQSRGYVGGSDEDCVTDWEAEADRLSRPTGDDASSQGHDTGDPARADAVRHLSCSGRGTAGAGMH